MKVHSKTIEKALDQKLVNARKENLQHLSNIEHRLEYVDHYNGIEYINDAKASDINSSWYSLENLDRSTIWIVSSCVHEEDYALLAEINADRLKAVIVMGSDQNRLIETLGKRVKLIGKVNNMEEAVSHATLVATEGDVVLFSPGFSDFENYTPYKELGQQFRKAVREMRL